MVICQAASLKKVKEENQKVSYERKPRLICVLRVVSCILCLIGGYHGSRPKALIPGLELFEFFSRYFSLVYWIEKPQVIS
jgi:hypothetical protein